MVDENARLSKRLERSLRAAHEHAESVGERMARDEESSDRLVRRLRARVEELEAQEALAGAAAADEAGGALAAVRDRLAESERRNRELREYVDGIRASYAAAFGDDGAQGEDDK